MAAQYMENIIIGGNEYPILTLPLESYWGVGNPRPLLKSYGNFCLRGYVGTWKIESGELYLVDLNTILNDIMFQDIFCVDEEKIKADWFCGDIRIPLGEILRYGESNSSYVYEMDWIIKVENGVVVSQRIIENKFDDH